MEAGMPTKSFKELVQRRVARDPAFGTALLREGIDTMLAGDLETGKSILRDYIKATVGLRDSAPRPAHRPKALFACSGRAETRKRVISSV
jgi:hypothetical protein